MVKAIAGKETDFKVDVSFAATVTLSFTAAGLTMLRQIRSQGKRLREQRVEIKRLEVENEELRDQNLDLTNEISELKGDE